MAEFGGGAESRGPNLNLTPEEQRLYTQIFSAADTEGIGVVTGDIALKFFPERTKLPAEALGEIWQIADTEDKGFLTPSGFYVVLRLIGLPPRTDLGPAGGPLPRIEGISTNPPTPASPIQAQASGGPVKVPPLTAEKATQYAMLFQQSGAQDGLLPGTTAKQIFDRAQLPNDILVRIWNLADTEQRGRLSTTEFIVAMHLLASYRGGSMRALPRNLPAGLWDAAARRNTTGRPPSSGSPAAAATTTGGLSRQFTGPATPRTSSPLAARSAFTTPQTALPPQSTGDWAVSAQEKAQFDAQFSRLDPQGRGFITGDQAATFFGNSRLSEEDLAHIWDLSDTKSRGQLNSEEFAVAMHLIRNRLQTRGAIPASLPPELVPPSTRNPQAQSLPTPSAQSSVQKPKSAAEDLFGLDALSDSAPAPAPQVSTALSPAEQTSTAVQAPTTAAQPSPTVFKPFVPSSSFGQSIVTPQATGTSKLSESSHSRDIHDDLLGDADPEINQRLTSETTELANLSTQVGNLTSQMQDVKAKRATTSTNLSSASKQKQEFEDRLAQLRSAYEREARDVRALEERLATSRSDTKKAQADLAMVQHTYNTLAEQKQQMNEALEADKRENAELKDRMREVNDFIAQMKPQIDKIKSDARQQKGLVAIHKKQLNGSEAERDRLKSELDGASREHDEATKDLEETKASIQRQGTSPLPAGATPPTDAPSSPSTNPFFRRQTTGSSERGISRSQVASESASSPNHSAFDSFFGSAFPSSESTSQPPPVSFGTPAAPEPPALETQSVPLPSPETLTPTPTSTQVPPPPPQSRQITSSSLPLKQSLQRPESPSSSVGVAPPASRFGDGSGQSTPVLGRHLSQIGAVDATDALANVSPAGETRETDRSTDSGPLTRVEQEEEVPVSAADQTQPMFSASSIPGSFPGDTTPPIGTPRPADDVESEVTEESKSVDDPFALGGISRSASSKDDFDSAFAGFDNKDKALAEPGTRAGAATSRAKEEFPPIQEFGDDSESDTGSEKGFADDFNAPSTSEAVSGTTASLAKVHNPTAPDSQLPTPNAEVSPPTYNQSVPTNGTTRAGSNQFPAEYTGLLPSREESATLEETTTNPVQQTSASIAPMSLPPQSVANVLPVPPLKSETFDDFDNDFADLSEAQSADDKAEEDFGSSRHGEFSDEFNPTFDSPAHSRMTASSVFGTDSGFEHIEAGGLDSRQAAGSKSSAAPVAPSDSDWDAMFAGLGPSGNTSNGNANGTLRPPGQDSNDAEKRAGVARALSQGTEHDDPILKSLTAMGYPRDQSLQALEKFDYNLDKAADYLTQQ